MFRLLPKVKAGEQLIITHKNEDYVFTKANTFKKQLLINKLKNLPRLNISRKEIREFINKGRAE
jgi:sortase (surface protein transpeptidase)